MKRYKRESEYSYALGMTVCFELLKYKKERVRAVYLHPSIVKNENYDRLVSLCKEADIDVVFESKIFNILSPKENCFVIGELEKYDGALSPDLPHIVLVSPSGSGNVGTIMRTMLGFGFYDLCLIPPCADPFSPETIRASMGAVFALNVKEYAKIEDYRKDFPEHALYPFMLSASTPIDEVDFVSPYSLVFGNEARGLPDEYAALGRSVIIPCSSNVDSLNLSVAAAIGMYCAKSNS